MSAFTGLRDLVFVNICKDSFIYLSSMTVCLCSETSLFFYPFTISQSKSIIYQPERKCFHPAEGSSVVLQCKSLQSWHHVTTRKKHFLSVSFYFIIVKGKKSFTFVFALRVRKSINGSVSALWCFLIHVLARGRYKQSSCILRSLGCGCRWFLAALHYIFTQGWWKGR